MPEGDWPHVGRVRSVPGAALMEDCWQMVDESLSFITPWVGHPSGRSQGSGRDGTHFAHSSSHLLSNPSRIGWLLLSPRFPTSLPGLPGTTSLLVIFLSQALLRGSPSWDTVCHASWLLNETNLMGWELCLMVLFDSPQGLAQCEGLTRVSTSKSRSKEAPAKG